MSLTVVSLLKTMYAGRALQAEGVDLCSRHRSSNVQICFSAPNRAVAAFHPVRQWTELCVVYFRRLSYEPLRSSEELIEAFPPHFPGALTFIPASLQQLVCKSRALGRERERWYFSSFKSLNPRERKVHRTESSAALPLAPAMHQGRVLAETPSRARWVLLAG